MPQVHLQTLGCRLNEAELESWSSDFTARGFTPVSRPDQADVVVINTCAVTSEAARKSRSLLRRAHRRNPRAKLVVSGCQATLEPHATGSIEGVDLLIPNSDKDRLVEITIRELDLEAMPALAERPAAAGLFARGRNRAFVKIQDGCRHRCTFCVVTVARGAERSRPPAKIIEGVEELVRGGIKEVVLTGVHVGGYGTDLDLRLYDLVQRILDETAVPRLRLASVEPWDLPPNFFDLFSDDRLMPHMHLPLQSGSDPVLRRMGRRCLTADFERLVDRARDAVPDLNVTTDIIVGFPGESEREWETGLGFIESMGFSHVHVFPYSPRNGTRAASLPGQLAPAVKKARSRELHELAAAMKLRAFETQLGRTLPVLLESGTEAADEPRCAGYTPNYLRVQAPVSDVASIENQICKVRLTSIAHDGHTLLGELR